MSVLIINPLRQTLAHYERALVETIESSGRKVEIADVVTGDGIDGAAHRISVLIRTLRERRRLARSVQHRVIIVVWPLFGYFDPVTLARLSRCNQVFLIMHDPLPLRRSYGQSYIARLAFRAASARFGIRIIYHTEYARSAGLRTCGVNGVVAPHPITSPLVRKMERDPGKESRKAVRVLGQYKDTRSIDALRLVAERVGHAYRLEIFGRGWPIVLGWKVQSNFLSEEEFASLVDSSDCVVIPYDAFFQSGVAVRCLESGIPIVGPRHEHIEQLFGSDWPGIVQDPSDWTAAVDRALQTDRSVVDNRLDEVRRSTWGAWKALLASA